MVGMYFLFVLVVACYGLADCYAKSVNEKECEQARCSFGKRKVKIT